MAGMATEYHGEATVIVSDREHIVHARLVQDTPPEGLPSWRGVLRSDEVVWFDLLGASLTIRLPDGREGTVIVSSHAIPSTSAQATGSGAAPF